MVRRLVVLAVACWLAASVYLFAWAPFATERPRQADAIVVLAGSRTRLPVALDLFRRGVAPVLAVSIDPGDRARRRFCRLPPSGAFCFQGRPFSTRGEARSVGRLAAARHWRSLALVTSRFHLFRAGLIVRRCTDARVELVAAPVTWWRWPEVLVTETAKLAVALTTRRGC